MPVITATFESAGTWIEDNRIGIDFIFRDEFGKEQVLGLALDAPKGISPKDHEPVKSMTMQFVHAALRTLDVNKFEDAKGILCNLRVRQRSIYAFERADHSGPVFDLTKVVDLELSEEGQKLAIDDASPTGLADAPMAKVKIGESAAGVAIVMPVRIDDTDSNDGLVPSLRNGDTSAIQAWLDQMQAAIPNEKVTWEKPEVIVATYQAELARITGKALS